MPEDQSALLGFINGAGDSCDSPSCSSYGSARIFCRKQIARFESGLSSEKLNQTQRITVAAVYR
ncbi:unnamed protein product [Toxocara canis]|uniref:HTH araC/xylS-type domain-containing protein n=1 Tax=Toxocara canis TaxID=6265 RepID=A0A183U7V4_TOXCA|nr:unnamed protein product [Toxocara canis]